MNRNKRKETKKPTHARNQVPDWKSIRALASKPIRLELDLEERLILINDDDLKIHKLKFSTKNIDHFIERYVEPEHGKQVTKSLTEAGKGVERPFNFCIAHPSVRHKFCFEYRYQIVYAGYSKTTLKGELVNIGRQKN